MFQGSEHVAKGEHFALVQAAGGTLNASTWLDRTNYFETLPSHELELALWLESDRLASLLPAMTQEKLDNQRDVVKNERRWAVDNQPYGAWDERIQALLFPEGHRYHHSTIGSMEDLNAASLEDVSEFFATYYAPNNAVLTVAGDFETDAAMQMIQRHFGPIPANPNVPPPPDMRRSAAPGQRAARAGSRPRAAAARLLRVPHARCSGPMRSRSSPSLPTCSAQGARLACTRPSCASASWRRTSASSPSRWSAGRRCSRCGPPRGRASARAAGGGALAEIDRARGRRPAATMSWSGCATCTPPRCDSSLERIGERADRLSHVHLPLRRAGAHQHRGEPLRRRWTRSASRDAMRDTLRPDNRLVADLPAGRGACGRRRRLMATRPARRAGAPRPYHFPEFVRSELRTGSNVWLVPLAATASSSTSTSWSMPARPPRTRRMPASRRSPHSCWSPARGGSMRPPSPRRPSGSASRSAASPAGTAPEPPSRRCSEHARRGHRAAGRDDPQAAFRRARVRAPQGRAAGRHPAGARRPRPPRRRDVPARGLRRGRAVPAAIGRAPETVEGLARGRCARFHAGITRRAWRT